MDAEGCAICHEADTGETFVRLECGHAFHGSCACRWFRAGKDTCPLCRSRPALRPAHALQRATAVRGLARRQTAPPCVKALVRRIRAAERRERDAKKEVRAIQEGNRDVLRALRRARTAQHARSSTVRRLKLRLGVSHWEGAPLPPLA